MPPTWVRHLVRLYPRQLRTAYADDLEASLMARSRVAGGSYVARLRFVVQVALDAARARWPGRTATVHDGKASGGVRVLTILYADLRSAGRGFARSPGFFAGLVFILALGIGANTAVFSLVKAVILRPLPYSQPDRLVMVWRSLVEPDPVEGYLRGVATPEDLLTWRTDVADVMAVSGVEATGSLDAQVDLPTAAGAERLNGAIATPDFFERLGIAAHLGQVFTTADGEAGRTDVVVLGHALWRRAFGGDPTIVGRTVTLVTGWNQTRAPRLFHVLGVLPPHVRFNYPAEVDVWRLRPWADVSREPPRSLTYQVVGRLNPGVSIARAQQRIAEVSGRLMPAIPDRAPGQQRTVRLEPMHDWVVAGAPPALLLLSSVALLLLLITCATVTNALFVRMNERHRELALRTALGASSTRLLTQLLLEGFVLAAVGTVTGVLLAAASLPALRALVPDAVPRSDELGIDGAVLLVAASTVVLVTMLTSLVPAWRGARTDVALGLKRGAATTSGDRTTARLRRALVCLQAAVATALLIVAGLLLVSFTRLVNVPVGFDAREVVTAELRLLGPEIADPSRLRDIHRALRDRAAAIPGVARVALASAVPFRGVDWYRSFEYEHLGKDVGGNLREVDPAFFEIMHIPLRRGRLFTEGDNVGATPVAVVSEAYAREAFGTSEAIGRTLGRGGPVIIGVVGDVRYSSYARNPMRAIYRPMAQSPSALICLLIESADGRPLSTATVRQAVADVDPALPAMQISTIGQILDASLADRRFYLVATMAFASLAFVLTLVGLAVIVVRTITERRRELAIRAALGASGSRLQAHVLRGGFLPVCLGVALGTLTALLSANVLSAFLFGVAPRSALVYTVVAGLLLSTAAAIGWAAGYRATAIEPALALRSE